MEDYEILKKYFIDKEKENLKLKEELELLKSKIDLSSDVKTNKSQIIESRNVTEIPVRVQSDMNFYSSIFLENIENKLEENQSDNQNLNFLSKSLVLNKGREKGSQINFNNGIFKEESNVNLPNTQLRDTISKSFEIFKNQTNNQIQLQNKENTPTPVIYNSLTQKEANSSFIPCDYGKNEENSKDKNYLLQSNKNVIKNIESNITVLKKQLNLYESAYQNINTNLDNKSNETEKALSHKLDYINNELFLKVKLQDQEIKKMKEIYENELKTKNDIYEKNIFHLNQTHQEEIRKLRINYENKIDEIIKKSEEEKTQHNRKFSLMEAEIIKFGTNKKSEINDKYELVEFKKRYIDEMKELQKSFENFKSKTYAEFKAMKKAKEEALEKCNNYQIINEKLKAQNEEKDKKYMEFLQETKILKKTNEHLMSRLENSKSEFNLLRAKLEKIENMFLNSNTNINNNIITASSYKSIQFIHSDMNTLSKDENIDKKEKESSKLKHCRQLSKYSDLVNYENNTNNNLKNKTTKNRQIEINKLSNYNTRNIDGIGSPSNINYDTEEDQDSRANKLKEKLNPNKGDYSRKNSSLDQNLYKAIDLKIAHGKIKEMEESLKYMNDENENLRGKLDYVINNITNMNNVPVGQYDPMKRKYSQHANLYNTESPNGNNINCNNDNSNDEKKSKTKLQKFSVNKSQNISPSVSKNKRIKNYSTEIYESMQRQIEEEDVKIQRELSSNRISKFKNNSSIENSGKNGSYRNKLANSIQVTPFVYDEKKKISNFRDMSPAEKQENMAKNKNLNFSIVNGDRNNESESNDDRIIEVPLQIKIKGKLRKIPTCERSPKS